MFEAVLLRTVTATKSVTLCYPRFFSSMRLIFGLTFDATL